MRLCPRCPTSPFDRVGKVAHGQRVVPSAAAGDFAHPTTFPDDGNALLARYSGLMLAARITLAHLSVSSARSLPNAAGVSAVAVPPKSAKRALILGSARAA